jgi:hypothetical protein
LEAIIMKAPAIIVAAALVFGLSSAAQAAPVETFYFTGTCAVDCTGFGTGTLVLTANYMLGQSINTSEFVSFNYSSNLPSSSLSIYNVAPPPGGLLISSIAGMLPGPSGHFGSPADVNIAAFVGGTPELVFSSSTFGMGVWCTGVGTTSCNSDGGAASVWTTPLPAALPLFATGIGGLGLLGWRRKRKARAAA